MLTDKFQSLMSRGNSPINNLQKRGTRMDDTDVAKSSRFADLDEKNMVSQHNSNNKIYWTLCQALSEDFTSIYSDPIQ